MNFDWNWFFSSFCQSAAALIGIIGAFVISRLLGFSDRLTAIISKFDNHVIEFNKLLGSISIRNFYWCTNATVRHSTIVKRAIKRGDFDNLKPKEIVEKMCDLDIAIYRIEDAIMEAFNEMYEDYRYQTGTTKIAGQVFPIAMPKLEPITEGLWEAINDEKDKINQLEIEAQTLIKYFKQNLQDLKSLTELIRPLKVIVLILIISFPLTVIYPLHFMPLPSNHDPIITFNLYKILHAVLSLKSFLLLLFFITIEGIFYYFLTLTSDFDNRLKSTIQRNSMDYQNIKNYSIHFEED